MQISTKTIWIATHRILQEAGVKTGAPFPGISSSSAESERICGIET